MPIFRLSFSVWLRLAVVLGCMGLAVGSLRGGDLRYPADGSGVLLTLPEDWTTAGEADGSLKCQSGDGEFSFVLFPNRVLRGPSRELPDIAQSMAKFAGLADIETQDGGEKVNPNGTRIAGIIVLGKKGGDELAGVVSVITPTEGDACAFQCFGTRSTLLVHSREMKAITDSFRSVK